MEELPQRKALASKEQFLRCRLPQEGTRLQGKEQLEQGSMKYRQARQARPQWLINSKILKEESKQNGIFTPVPSLSKVFTRELEALP